MRLIIGMTGATGAPLGVRLLEELHEQPEVETHLVLSRWARTTIELETGYSAREVGKLADLAARGLERVWLRWHPAYQVARKEGA